MTCDVISFFNSAILAFDFSLSLRPKSYKSLTLSCPFAKRVGDWASDIKAKSIAHVGGYNCRKIAGSPFMSQHSYGKAIDIVKINGVAISDEWKEATASACNHFNNVLPGPGSDKAHAHHLHLDSGFGRPCWAKHI